MYILWSQLHISWVPSQLTQETSNNFSQPFNTNMAIDNVKSVLPSKGLIHLITLADIMYIFWWQLHFWVPSQPTETYNNPSQNHSNQTVLLTMLPSKGLNYFDFPCWYHVYFVTTITLLGAKSTQRDLRQSIPYKPCHEQCYICITF